MVSFPKIDSSEIQTLSKVASEIVREHFDPIIGTAQNDYMLAKFQSEEAIREQFEHGYRYYWVEEDNTRVGFLAFFPKDGKMYLSKFYVMKEFRGRHLAGKMLQFIIEETKKEGLDAIYLNVNRGNLDTIAIYEHLGFEIVRQEKNDIGGGFFMDDHVLEYQIGNK